MFDFLLGPDVYDPLSHLYDLWSRNLTYRHIVSQRVDVNAEFMCCLSR